MEKNPAGTLILQGAAGGAVGNFLLTFSLLEMG